LGATTLSDVLNSSSSLDDELEPLDYDFLERDTSHRTFSNPNRLTNTMDVLLLHLYCIEFCGDGDRARKDSNFLAKRLMDMQKRIDSIYENRVLVAFCKMDEDDFMAMFCRRDANDWWKSAFKSTACVDMNPERNWRIYDKYRLHRINALKKVYGEEWENYIWRILDIDDIGEYFNQSIPEYKAAEEKKIACCNVKNLMCTKTRAPNIMGFPNWS